MHLNVAIHLNNLVALLQDTNCLAEAELLMQCVFTIDEQSFGPVHPKVVIRLNNLVQLLQDTNRLAEAELLMHRVVRILLNFTRNTGYEHPYQSVYTTNYEMLLRALGQSEADIRRVLEALKAKPR